MFIVSIIIVPCLDDVHIAIGIIMITVMLIAGCTGEGQYRKIVNEYKICYKNLNIIPNLLSRYNSNFVYVPSNRYSKEEYES